MARDGSGTYTAPVNSVNPAVAATTIVSADFNALVSDLETALTTSLASDGTTTASASIPFANGIQADVIAEITASGNGVTIDSVLLKDGRVDSAQGGDIASATTTDIGAMTGNYGDVTGTTTITGLGTITAGRYRSVTFTGILTLTHNGTSLILPGGANITTAANDAAGFVSLGSGNWKCLWYTKADGTPLAGAGIASLAADATPQLGGDLDPDGNGIAFTGATVTDVTGSDTLLVSGTAGSNGNLVSWNGDGDAVDSGVAAASVEAATKELFIPVLKLGGNSGNGLQQEVGDFPAMNAGAADFVLFSFLTPADFTSLTAAEVIVIPDTTETVGWDAATDFGAVGEAYNANSDAITSQTVAVTANELAALDISGALTGLAASDFVGVKFDSNTTTLQILGLRVKYS